MRIDVNKKYKLSRVLGITGNREYRYTVFSLKYRYCNRDLYNELEMRDFFSARNLASFFLF